LWLGRDEFWHDRGKGLAGADTQKPGKASIYLTLQGRITGCFVSYQWRVNVPRRKSSVTIGQR